MDVYQTLKKVESKITHKLLAIFKKPECDQMKSSLESNGEETKPRLRAVGTKGSQVCAQSSFLVHNNSGHQVEFGLEVPAVSIVLSGACLCNLSTP